MKEYILPSGTGHPVRTLLFLLVLAPMVIVVALISLVALVVLAPFIARNRIKVFRARETYGAQ